MSTSATGDLARKGPAQVRALRPRPRATCTSLLRCILDVPPGWARPPHRAHPTACPQFPRVGHPHSSCTEQRNRGLSPGTETQKRPHNVLPSIKVIS